MTVSRKAELFFFALIFCVFLPGWVAAQNVMTIDATAPAPPPQPVQAKMGASRNPQGHVIGVNSQYLTFDGKPWLPVMGEFHFSRYPEAEWEREILKMKAAGVQIVSTYIIWIHHEQEEGVFNWTGQRDLRRFVELCGEHGMYAFPRIGPWAHAETRNGGLPDWVLKKGPVRQDDPIYLDEVSSFYAEIGKQLQGLLWKDGGPVIGIQIENEYRERGPGKGEQHIRTLKKMALADGMDVPLYTVTGWDGAAIPLDTALPVFGGYPDAPWDGSPKKMPPNEVYAFRFDNRSAGSMGAVGGRGQSAASTYRGTPFLTAEVGDGIEDTYFRRPVVDADDVAAIAPVMLGSGDNLLGYYMFHGGRNPDGGAITLQESQRTGYPTDVPVESYDFQAPLGEFGQVRESLRKLKLVHYFLNDFGEMLAPMIPRAPRNTPADPSDASIARLSARTSGEQGFIFLSNYVRGLTMPERAGFQVRLQLPSGTLNVPETPIRLPSGAYGIWPVNLPLSGAAEPATLRYTTAQLFKRIEFHGETYYFFFALPGITPEFMLNSATHVEGMPDRVNKADTPIGLRLRVNDATSADIHLAGGIHLILLPQSLAESVWRVDDPSLLLSAKQSAYSDGSHWTIESVGDPKIDFGLFGAGEPPRSADAEVRSVEAAGLFHEYEVSLPPLHLQVKATQVQKAGPPPAVQTGAAVSWRPHPIAMVPDDAAYKAAAVWRLDLPDIPANPHLADVYLNIAYQGDAARLSRGTQLLDDNFWNGLAWSVGLKELGGDLRKLELSVLPLAKNYPMYIEKAPKLHFNSVGVAGALISVDLTPGYKVVLQAPNHDRR